jgi:hypothetical protein
MCVDEFIRVCNEKMFVQLFLEVLTGSVRLASSPGAIQKSPGPGDEHGVPGVVDTLPRHKTVSYK